MMEISYHKAENGMLYPNLGLPQENVSITNLGRFAVRAAEYLKEFYKERYQTLVRFGKLAEKMQEVEAEAYQMMEELENMDMSDFQDSETYAIDSGLCAGIQRIKGFKPAYFTDKKRK